MVITPSQVLADVHNESQSQVKNYRGTKREERGINEKKADTGGGDT